MGLPALQSSLEQEAAVQCSRLILGWCCLKPASSFHCFTPSNHRRRKKGFLLQEKAVEGSAFFVIYFYQVGVVLSLVRNKVCGVGRDMENTPAAKVSKTQSAQNSAIIWAGKEVWGGNHNFTIFRALQCLLLSLNLAESDFSSHQ